MGRVSDFIPAQQPSGCPSMAKAGSIQVGLEGDLLVVEGNPADNISDTRNIRYVFNNEKLVDRDSLTKQWKH